MREIKFRRFNTINNEMVSWDTLCGETYAYDGQGSAIPTPLGILNDDENWMEFTGLQDKNGKEIYEGDILNDEDGIYLVRNCRMGFEWFGLSGDSIKNSIYSGDWTIDITGTIIGNIHENPELLKSD